MTQSIDGQSRAARVAQGYFMVGGQKLNFQDLVVLMGFKSLEAQDKTFETLFNEAQERTEQMQSLNNALQMLNTYKDHFDKDGNAIKRGGYEGYFYTDADRDSWIHNHFPYHWTASAEAQFAREKKERQFDPKLVGLTEEDMKIWLEEYYPALVETGLVQAGSWSPSQPERGIGNDGIFTKQELDVFLENGKLAQTNLSSTNEQQMIRTNQAANKRATILQQLQTLLGASKEGMTAAAK